MSKEHVRQIVSGMFRNFKGLAEDRKAYPNYAEPPIPEDGMWARLDLDFVTSEVVGIGSDPYVRRTGVVSIKVREHLDRGTRRITMLTDALEQHFQLKYDGSLYLDAANTVNSDSTNVYYESIVYIPFTYDPQP